jgi:hypothetical protein
MKSCPAQERHIPISQRIYRSKLHLPYRGTFILLVFYLLTVSPFAFSGDKSWQLKGYTKFLGMYYKPGSPVPGINADDVSLQLIHNRLNFKWFPLENMTVDLEVRNRLNFMLKLEDFPEYIHLLDMDNGLVDLSFTVASGDKWFLLTQIDRAWMDWSKGKWQVTAGRQRINWSVNLIWNPNDIFNAYSFFDFDYEERPGTDALRIQYYGTETSSAELVCKPGRKWNESAVAGMYRFSKWDYDFQFLGGRVGPDWVLGSGWMGDIKGGGFRGEISWFIPQLKESESWEALVASISGDYTLKNSLYLHGGFLFNSHGTRGPAGGRSFFDQVISAKLLTYAMYSLFAQCTYPFTPLFNGSISGILNPSDHSIYFGPTLSYSLANNLELMVTGQMFSGRSGTEFGDYGKAVYWRLKWAF